MVLSDKKRHILALLFTILPLSGSLLVDWRLVLRAMSYPEAPIMAADWYQPQARVLGGKKTPLATAPPPASLSQALREISAYAQDRNSTGLVVMHREHIIWEEYWQGYDAGSAFNSMSMAKTIVGLLVGIAIAEGFINSIEDPVAQYIPEWRQDERRQISLRDLLYMQSGLRNERRTDTPTSDLVQMYLGSDVAQVALNIPQAILPGQDFDYNNVNSQVLAIVLQHATGMTYTDYLSTRLWQAIGADEAHLWLDRPEGMGKTFCCLFATARDWVRVGQLLLNNGQIGGTQVVPSAWLAQMLTPSPLEATFGAHIWVKARTPSHPNVDQSATGPFLAADTFYLDGRDLQRVYVLPSHELVIVRMGEAPGNWDDSVIPNSLVKALRPL